MIKYNYEVSVNENRAKLNKDIFLFRGNRNIHYYFSIKGARFTFSKENEDLLESSNAIYAAVTVVKPNGVEVANAIAPVEDGLIHLKVTEDLIDEEVEVGDFDLVFDLFDDNEGAVTIPKIKGQFHVQERPCTTSIGILSGNVNVVNQAVVDLAIATQENEQLIVVDDDGKYVKTTWAKGDKISVERLNKMEEGIYNNSSRLKNIGTGGSTNASDITITDVNDNFESANVEGALNELGTQYKDIANEMENITVTGGGLSYTAKKAILDLFGAVAYYNKDIANTYQILKDALLVAVDSIVLDKTELTFTSATSQTLVATKSPVESEGTIVWTSSDPSVATVDNNGIVIATGNGECTITATCGSVYATCNVSVSGILQTYTITNNLTNVTTSNNIDNIAEGTGYIATLTADSNYVISSVTVTMGGEDITSTAYSNGSVSISSVTGDVVITAIAIEDVGWISGIAYNVEWTDGYTINSETGENTESSSMSVSNYLPVKNVDMLIAENIYTNYGIYYYDENKSFLGTSERTYVVSNTNYSIPRNVHYVRVTKRLSTANAVVTPYDNEQLTENTEWKSNTYYSLNWKDGVGLNTSTGVEGTNTSASCSELAFCYSANTLQFSSGARTFVFFYNSNKEFLEYKIRQNATEPMTIPETAQYFRINGTANVTNYWVQLA